MKSLILMVSLLVVTGPAYAAKVLCAPNEQVLNEKLSKEPYTLSVSAPAVAMAKAAPGVALAGFSSSIRDSTPVQTGVIICVTVK
jgi:hypothetical protein